MQFGAIPQRTCHLPIKGGDKECAVTIYELEPDDMPVLDALEKRTDFFGQPDTLLPKDTGNNYRYSYNSRIRAAVRVAQLQQEYSCTQHTQEMRPVVYMAISEGFPYGILVGNPRYCRTRIPPETCPETTLEWICTWPIGSLAKHVKGIGKALMLQFFDFAAANKKSSIELRSTRPESSVAFDFYKSLNFQVIKDDDANPIDMKIDNKGYERKANQLKEELKSEEIQDKTSVHIEDIIDLDKLINSPNEE